MPITDADLPITDQQADLKIDNQVERIYLYRISSSSLESVIRVGLRFYKYNRKWEGLDTFISEDGLFYISAFRISGSSGLWIIAPTIGQGGSAANRLAKTGAPVTNFGPIEGQYSSIAVSSATLSRITSDTR